MASKCVLTAKFSGTNGLNSVILNHAMDKAISYIYRMVFPKVISRKAISVPQTFLFEYS